MGQKTKTVKHLHTHLDALQNAIANLEQFANKNQSAPIAHVVDLAVKEGQLVDSRQTHLQKTMALARGFVAAIFSTKAYQKRIQKKSLVQDVVLKAIDVIKRNYLLIEQLRKGNPEEQLLAASTLAVIKRYNAVFEQSNQHTGDWGTSIARFFYKHSGLSVDDTLKHNRIDLPRFHTVYCQPVEDAPNQKISHAFQSHVAHNTQDCAAEFSAVMLTKMMADPLSRQETDLLRMKASTLLRQHGIRFHSMAEALQAIKEAPIITDFDEISSVATLRLSLTLIPGVTIEIQGNFQRDSQAVNHSIPLSDQFKLTYASLHNGFPHPLQHTGWALSNALVPSYPHRLDMMPLFKPLYIQKQEAIKALLPEGTLLENARESSRKRTHIFESHSSFLLALHKELSLAIMEAAPIEDVPSNAEEVINHFYTYLASHPKPLDCLALTHQKINKNFIERSHAKLQDAWLTRIDNNPILAQQARALLIEDGAQVLEIFEKECEVSSSTEVCAFSLCMGSILQPAVHSILMQHFSETFGYAPKMLNDFEQKVQAAAYNQLIHFMNELDGAEITNETIRQSLIADIELFKIDTCDSLEIPSVKIAHELEFYFNTRYYSVKS